MTTSSESSLTFTRLSPHPPPSSPALHLCFSYFHSSSRKLFFFSSFMSCAHSVILLSLLLYLCGCYHLLHKHSIHYFLFSFLFLQNCRDVLSRGRGQRVYPVNKTSSFFTRLSVRGVKANRHVAACCCAAGADQPELTSAQRNDCFLSGRDRRAF